jgi:hypothetical protein
MRYSQLQIYAVLSLSLCPPSPPMRAFYAPTIPEPLWPCPFMGFARSRFPPAGSTDPDVLLPLAPTIPSVSSMTTLLP